MYKPRTEELCKYAQQVYKSLAYRVTAESIDFVWHNIWLVKQLLAKIWHEFKERFIKPSADNQACS